MWKWMAAIMCAIVLSSAAYCTVPSNVICVNCSGGNDSNDGTSWNAALATIEAATAVANMGR